MTPCNHRHILIKSMDIIKTMIRKKIKIFSFPLFLGCSLGAYASEIEVVEPIPIEPLVISVGVDESKKLVSVMEAKRITQGAAILDSVSTHLALAKGGREMNPLVNTSPVGLAALAIGRIALMEYADAKLTEEEKAKQFPISAAISVGAVINNALVLGTSVTPLGLIGAAAGGLALWQYYKEKTRDESEKKIFVAVDERKNESKKDVIVYVEPIPVEPVPYYIGIASSIAATR